MVRIPTVVLEFAMSAVLQEVPKPGSEGGIEVTQSLPGQEQ